MDEIRPAERGAFSRRLLLGSLAAIACVETAQAQAKPTAVVARVIVDPAVSSPPGFAGILRRELELSLDSTGLFTIPTRDPAELNAVLDEIERTRGRGAPVHSVQTVIAPTITSVELNQRRRPAPYQQMRDIVTISGSISLQITVLNAHDASVLSRFPLNAIYRDDGTIVDRNAPAGTIAADSNAYVLLARQAGRELANYLMARNPSASSTAAPILVADRDGNHVFLTPIDGLALGDELRVFAPGGREIRNPATGEVIGRVDTEIGRVRVIELQPRMAVAEIVSSTVDITAGAQVRR